MLKLEQVSCAYGKVQALHGVCLEVADGALVSLLGANGAGKSTCLRAISRMIHLRDGRILLGGIDISGYPTDRVVRLGLIHVPERRMIFPELNVIENLWMGAYLRKDRRQLRNDLERVFQYFPRLKERQKQTAATLSGGEQQMLAIGRGLMGRPRVLLLDEPSLGLAPIVAAEVFGIIRAINKAGTTILLVEQNAAMGLAISNYAYILETGVVALEGPSANLLSDGKMLESYLGKKESNKPLGIFPSSQRSKEEGT